MSATDKHQRSSRILLFTIYMAIMLLAFVNHSVAELATKAEMDQVCQNWLTQITYSKGAWSGDIAPKIDRIENLMAGDTLLAYIYHISPKGFVVVPVLKEMTPVKAYSDDSFLDENQEGGFLLMLRETLSQRMNLYSRTYGDLNAIQPSSGEAIFGRGQKSIWENLTMSSENYKSELAKNAYKQATEAGPLLIASWHQRAPYNNYCPEGDGGRTVVGCVATATAQILDYWQWPEKGVGTHSYTWSGDQSCEGDVGGGLQTAEYFDEYDWAHIIDSCDDGCLPEDSMALAEICREVGVAFNMNYGFCGSGASTASAVSVFPTYFKYSSDTRLVNRINYDISEWYDLVQEEIDNSRPIQYRIRSHSIVLDGYREQVPGQYEYHMNYGWANSFNSWYIFDSLYCSWVEPDSICPYDEEFMITHIYPQTEPILDYVACTISDSNGDNDGVAESGEEIELSLTIHNYGWDATNSSGVLSSSDSYVNITTSTALFTDSIEWGADGMTLTPFVVSIDPGIPDPHLVTFELTTSTDGTSSVVDTFIIFTGSTAGISDDFESGQGYWSHENVTHTFLDEWHLDDYRTHSGNYSWKVGGIGADDYNNSLDAGLMTPPFLLPLNAELSFWHWIDTEEAWDGAIVMISSGDGWEQIFPDGGYPFEIVDNPANALPGGTPCYSAYNDWTEANFDLSAYSGVVQLMFRFASDAAETGEGWYVDDIAVTGDEYLCGDINFDMTVNILDITYLINFLYKQGPAPVSTWATDVNSSGTINILDVTHLIAFLYKSGEDPDCL